MGVPMTREIAPTAMKIDITPARFSKGRFLATSVVDIGIIIEPPSPASTLKIMNKGKTGAKYSPRTENPRIIRPVMSSDL
jgi:hypothetical protein